MTPGYNTTAFYMLLLGVARGNTLIVNASLYANNAFVYGTLISSGSGNVTLSGNASVGEGAKIFVDGGFSSGLLVLSNLSNVNVSNSGILSTDSLVMKQGSTLNVGLSSNIAATNLTIENGTTLIIALTDADFNGTISVNSNFTYKLKALSIGGSFSSIQVDTSNCSTCSISCMTTDSRIDQSQDLGRLEVYFHLKDDGSGLCSSSSSPSSFSVALVLSSSLFVLSEFRRSLSL